MTIAAAPATTIAAAAATTIAIGHKEFRDLGVLKLELEIGAVCLDLGKDDNCRCLM